MDLVIVDCIQDKLCESESFVDFVFGCDDSIFVGVYCFSVSWLFGDLEVVIIGFLCIVVNLGMGKNMVFFGILVFYCIYVILFFRDVFVEVQDVLKVQKC